MRSAVQLPTRLGLLRTEPSFLAVADGTDSIRLDTEVFQLIPDRVGAIVAQSQVVLLRAPFIAVTRNQQLVTGMRNEKIASCSRVSLSCGGRANSS